MSGILIASQIDQKKLKLLILPLIISGIDFLTITFFLDLNGPYLADFIVCLVASYFLYIISKDNLYYVINVLVIIFLLYAVNKLKIQYLGTPVLASDLLSILALYDIQSYKVQILFLVSVTVISLLFVLNIRYTRRTFYILFVIHLLAPASYLYAYTALNCGNAKGSCVYDTDAKNSSAIQQFSLSLIDLGKELFEYPTEEEVVLASNIIVDENYRLDGYFTSEFKRTPNIYFFLVESLWDPTSLPNVVFSQDPFYGKFRDLWHKGGSSIALSPVFGGGTANPEYELLCGMPVTTNVIQFELPVLNSDLPCLPNLLQQHGYTTVASHPNIRGFWNRDEAYPKLGFEKYYSINDFTKEDLLSGTYLSDQSLYAQNVRHISEVGNPIFNYVLTASEHYPYVDIGKANRAVDIGSGDSYLSRYVNLIHLGTKHLYNYYQHIRDTDPNAIIVILGDHLPLLGKDYEHYRDAGYFTDNPELEPKKLLRKYAVPLIVVDGEKGPIKLDIVSIYEIPSIVVSLLLENDAGVERRTQGDVPAQARSIPNKGVLYRDVGDWHFCKLNSMRQECREPLDWLWAAQAISKDITIGQQLSLREGVHANASH